jgi:hypothetical protein
MIGAPPEAELMNPSYLIRGALVLACLMETFGVAEAASLKIVKVGAPAINCVFNPTCQVVVTDSLGTIPVPAITGKAPWTDYGPAVLQSRAYAGAAGAPAAGETAYVYRMVMSFAVGATCVNALKLDVGPIKKHYYNLSGALADVFVTTTGGLGTIGLASAAEDGDTVTFTFEKPVCAGSAPEKGDTSFFFGFAAAGAPMKTTAKVQVVSGPAVDTPARTPQH